jgi:hypothetical protein
MEEVARTLQASGIGVAEVEVLFAVDGLDIWAIAVEDLDPLPLWHALRARTEDTGIYPLFVRAYIDVRERLRTGEQIDEDIIALGLRDDGGEQHVEGVIQGGLVLDIGAWMHDMLADFAADIEDFPDSLRGDWPDGITPRSHFTIVDTAEHPGDLLYLALIPTRLSWHVPAFLMYGRYHSWLDPEHHVAVLKRWYDQYGAELVGVMPDTVEMRVLRPPRTRDEALKLAWEHFAYCQDLLGYGIDAIAAHLLNAPVWYFWWD